jgi:hypothetical protein
MPPDLQFGISKFSEWSVTSGRRTVTPKFGELLRADQAPGRLLDDVRTMRSRQYWVDASSLPVADGVYSLIADRMVSGKFSSSIAPSRSRRSHRCYGKVC